MYLTSPGPRKKILDTQSNFSDLQLGSLVVFFFCWHRQSTIRKRWIMRIRPAFHIQVRLGRNEVRPWFSPMLLSVRWLRSLRHVGRHESTRTHLLRWFRKNEAHLHLLLLHLTPQNHVRHMDPIGWIQLSVQRQGNVWPRTLEAQNGA